VAAEGLWNGYLTGIGSEWSRLFPGYVAGAVDAAEAGVLAWQQQVQHTTDPPPAATAS
jgi:monoamine oxidase